MIELSNPGSCTNFDFNTPTYNTALTGPGYCMHMALSCHSRAADICMVMVRGTSAGFDDHQMPSTVNGAGWVLMAELHVVNFLLPLF
mmetsp:Transcript_18483/g.39708  ORF Transcript_18483/g.39708 Transcript_18483/m.39708 type:complete len:87 (-) Transcript_18483:467-727(-)